MPNFVPNPTQTPEAVHKVKDKVTREVARMYKDLEFSVRADDWDKYPGFLRLPLEFSGRFQKG